MKKNLWIVTLALATWLGTACSSQQNEQLAQEKTSSEEFEKIFGEAVDESLAFPVAALREKMVEEDSIGNLTVTGTVTDVCQAKGCWMTLAMPDGSSVRVKFKDYALFMPQQIKGRDVVIRGFAKREVTPVDELRHYAEDAGKSEEEIAAITEPQIALAFEADGVLIK